MNKSFAPWAAVAAGILLAGCVTMAPADRTLNATFAIDALRDFALQCKRRLGIDDCAQTAGDRPRVKVDVRDPIPYSEVQRTIDLLRPVTACLARCEKHCTPGTSKNDLEYDHCLRSCGVTFLSESILRCPILTSPATAPPR